MPHERVDMIPRLQLKACALRHIIETPFGMKLEGLRDPEKEKEPRSGRTRPSFMYKLDVR
jgi:hypothetical protein